MLSCYHANVDRTIGLPENALQPRLTAFSKEQQPMEGVEQGIGSIYRYDSG